MSRKATTFRLDDTVQAELALLSELLDCPMNRLVNDAVKSYLDRRGREVERDLEANLERLRAYRRRDPDFERAIAEFAEAEAGGEDPLEGEAEVATGPVQAEIDRLLNGRLGRR